MSGNPQSGKGHKEINCDHYEDCLGLAAKKGWVDFNCGSCTLKKKEPGVDQAVKGEQQTTKLCADCEKNPTMSSSCPYCPSCMSKRSHKKKQAPPKGPGGPKKEKTTPGITSPEKSPEKRNMKVTLDFVKYGNILDQIEGLAEEEMRPVDIQIIYMLKKSL